jgi:1,4-alpha-glucan branching enzyme
VRASRGTLTAALGLAIAVLGACSGQRRAAGGPGAVGPNPGPVGEGGAGAGAGGAAAGGAAPGVPGGREPPPPDPVGPAPTGACPRPGLGAIAYDGGVMFRVWAPHAERVLVTGDFNGWSQSTDELQPEGQGTFAACVPGARVGHAYQLVLHRQGRVLVRTDPRARQLRHSSGAGVVVAPQLAFSAPAFTPPPASGQVIYELHLGTFNDTPGGPPGTFRSAIARLDHLAALGVNMIELLPPAEFAGDFSWGYNPAFPFAPETTYGAPQDLADLIDAAHARGLGVIVDVVHNHWGPQDLSMWCWAGECLGAGGVYFYADSRGQTGWGPRPDYGRPEVRRYILDAALTWLDDYRADGLRWDSTINIRRHAGGDIPDGWRLLQAINDATDARPAPTIQIAEDLQGDDALTAPTAGGGAGFDAQWDGFFAPVNEAIIGPVDSARDLAAVRAALLGRPGVDPFRRVIYTESHDEVANGKRRIPSMIDPAAPDSIYARKRSTLGAALVLTAPGVPMLFQGQELLEDGWFTDTDPVDWTRAERFAGILALYRDLIDLRRNRAGHTGGLQGPGIEVFHLNDKDKVLAYRRFSPDRPGDDVVVVASFANRDFNVYRVGLPAAGVWKVRLDSDSKRYGADHGGPPADQPLPDLQAQPGPRDGQPFQGDLRLGRYAVVILSQGP